jgi:hypothetical protein
LKAATGTMPNALWVMKMPSEFRNASGLMTRLFVARPSAWQIYRTTARVMPGSTPRPVGTVQMAS